MTKPKSEMCYLCQPPREHARGEPHKRGSSRRKDMLIKETIELGPISPENEARVENIINGFLAQLAEYKAKEAARRRRKADAQKRWRAGAKEEEDMSERGDLKPGSFYWVLPVFDLDSDPDHWSQDPQPARFDGYTADGTAHWVYLGQEDDAGEHWPVRWVGAEITRTGA